LTENSIVFGNSKSAGVVIDETRTVASIAMLISETTVNVGLPERNEAGETRAAAISEELQTVQV